MVVYRWQLESPVDAVESALLAELKVLRKWELNAAQKYPDIQPKWELQHMKFGWFLSGRSARQAYRELCRRLRVANRLP